MWPCCREGMKTLGLCDPLLTEERKGREAGEEESDQALSLSHAGGCVSCIWVSYISPHMAYGWCPERYWAIASRHQTQTPELATKEGLQLRSGEHRECDIAHFFLDCIHGLEIIFVGFKHSARIAKMQGHPYRNQQQQRNKNRSEARRPPHPRQHRGNHPGTGR